MPENPTSAGSPVVSGIVSLAAPQLGPYSVVVFARPSGTQRFPPRSIAMPLVDEAGWHTVGGLFVLSFKGNHSTLEPPNCATAMW
ncbi:MAG TPA: hypothetical protein VGG51_08345 [Candidatus Cybelea sp.]